MAEGETSWFALVDGASDPALADMARSARDSACLFSGKLEPDLAAVSPYLVRVDPREPLLHAWQDRGRGKNWGLLVEATVPLEPLRKHFRRFLQAKMPDGEVVMFRFYDPRVFAPYIRTAPPEQRAAWFEGVRQYSVEGYDGVQHSFRLRGGRLFDGDHPLEGTA